jgi:hypothetical protein
MSQYLDNQYAARVMKLLIAPNPVAKDSFDKIVLEVRHLIETLPGGPLKLRQYAVAHRFILAKLPAVVTEEISAFAKTETYKAEYLKMLEFVIENQLRLVEEEMAVKDAMWFFEDGEGGAPAGAPANSTAGIAPQPGEPVIDKKRKRLAKLYARTEE